MNILLDTSLNGLHVSIFMVHGYHHASGPGPEYWVDITDGPRQMGLAVSNACPSLGVDAMYPVWNKFANAQRMVHDDFGNLILVR